jgi:hypothetical protein
LRHARTASSSIAFTGRIALVECVGDEARIAIEAERELRQVVRADRESVEVLEELLGEDCVRRHFAHHDKPQLFLTAPQAVLREQLNDAFCLRPPCARTAP